MLSHPRMDCVSTDVSDVTVIVSDVTVFEKSGDEKTDGVSRCGRGRGTPTHSVRQRRSHSWCFEHDGEPGYAPAGEVHQASGSSEGRCNRDHIRHCAGKHKCL